MKRMQKIFDFDYQILIVAALVEMGAVVCFCKRTSRHSLTVAVNARWSF